MAPTTAISRPHTTQLVRSVAMYSMITKSPKKISEVPRSRSKISTRRLSIQIVAIGPSWRPGGSRTPRTRRPDRASASRFTVR